MNKISGKDLLLLLARIILGVGMGTHGWSKLQKILNGDFQFADPMGIGQEASLILAMSAELFCSILVIIGWKTRWAVWPIIFTMCVVVFIVKWGAPFSEIELSLMYLAGFLCLAATGAGKLRIAR